MITDALLARRRVILTCAVLIAFAGYQAFRSMPRALEPEVDAPVAIVEMLLPGVSVEELELLLTRRVERELNTLTDVASVEATTRDGAVVMIVELPPGEKEREDAYGRLAEKLGELRASLANDFIGLQGPRLLRPSQQRPELLIAIAKSTSNPGDAPPVADAARIADRLQALPEVARVIRVGEPSSRIVLTYDDRQLIDTGLTPGALRDYLRSQSFTAPGDYLDRGDTLAPIETAARIGSIDALEQLQVRDPDDGDAVSLSRLLDIETEELSPAAEKVLFDGRPSIVLAVERQRGTSMAAYDDAVQGALKTAIAGPAGAADTPNEIEAHVIVAQPELVRQEIDTFKQNFLIGFVLILGLLILALGFRTGLAVAIAVPLVISASFCVLSLFGLTVDLVLLSSLVLVLGMLVDNHIVMAERIHRLRGLGLPTNQAIARAAKDLAGPLFAASATTVCGFLPVYLTDHFVGQYVRPLFWVVLTVLSISFLFSVFVTPLLLRRGAWSGSSREPGIRAYRAVLSGLARAPIAIALALFLVVICYGGIRRLMRADQVFFPASSRALWSLEIEHAAGTDVDKTGETLRSLTAALDEERARDGSPLKNHVAFLGRSAPSFQASQPRRLFEPNYAQILLVLEDGSDGDDMAGRLRAAAASLKEGTLGDAHVRLRPVRLGADVEWPIAVRIRGDEATIRTASDDVKALLAELECKSVGDDWNQPIEKLRVIPNRENLADKNLTPADLTLAMHTVLHGLPVFDLTTDEGRFPVVLRAKRSRADLLAALNDAYVYPAKGEPSILYEVADVKKRSGWPARSRDLGKTAITVHAEAAVPMKDLSTERAVDLRLDTLRAQPQYADIEFEIEGLYASSKKANKALLDEIPVAAIAVLLLLLLMSRSVVDTLLILLAIPLSFVGVATGVEVTGEPFSFMTLVGMIALAGLVVNNAIVLLASLRDQRALWTPEDGPLRQALIQTASDRVRPIVLTALCAVASMGVLYQSGGPMWRPLASTIISGLLFSTVMVLFALPILYIGFAGRKNPPALGDAAPTPP